MGQLIADGKTAPKLSEPERLCIYRSGAAIVGLPLLSRNFLISSPSKDQLYFRCAHARVWSILRPSILKLVVGHLHGSQGVVSDQVDLKMQYR